MHTTLLRLVWLLVTVGLAGWLAFTLASPAADRRVFQPGPLTDGHHQIELACEACHAPFDGVRQDACLDCHAAELEAALDSHAASIFDDPRNAADLVRIDGRACITCHTEHRPEITAAMGVTLPADFCAPCHETVADDRPSHEGLSIDTCASGGCHNYHDNRALYEDFLVEHGRTGPDTFEGVLPPREAWVSWEAGERTPLTAADADLPASAGGDRALIDAWAGSAHAAAGVGCGACHRSGGAAWTDQPGAACLRRLPRARAGGLPGEPARHAPGRRSGGDVAGARAAADASRREVADAGLRDVPRRPRRRVEPFRELPALAGLQPPVGAAPPQELAHGARQLHPAQARTVPHDLADQRHVPRAEGASREPRRRRGHRRGVSLPNDTVAKRLPNVQRGAPPGPNRNAPAGWPTPGWLPERGW